MRKVNPTSPKKVKAHKDKKYLIFILVLTGIINFIMMPNEQYIGDPMAVRMASSNLVANGDIAVPRKLRFGARGKFFFEKSLLLLLAFFEYLIFIIMTVRLF